MNIKRNFKNWAKPSGRSDRTGAGFARDPLSLPSALRAPERDAQRIPMEFNPTPTRRFIVNPLTSGGPMTLSNTHSPMHARIRRLERFTEVRP